jgi:hypothetical protein
MEYPRAHLYQASIQRFFPVVASSGPAAHLATIGSPSFAAASPESSPFVLEGLGNVYAAVTDDATVPSFRHFRPRAGTTQTLAINVDLWAAQEPIDVDNFSHAPLVDPGQ